MHDLCSTLLHVLPICQEHILVPIIVRLMDPVFMYTDSPTYEGYKLTQNNTMAC